LIARQSTARQCRQRLYAAARGRDVAEVAYALKDALATKGTRTAFAKAYKGIPSGIRRGLARLLADDPDALAFFDDLISSVDENRPRRMVWLKPQLSEGTPASTPAMRRRRQGRLKDLGAAGIRYD
jgi:hypothetical protein